jgi:hypothetical protein
VISLEQFDKSVLLKLKRPWTMRNKREQKSQKATTFDVLFSALSVPEFGESFLSCVLLLNSETGAFQRQVYSIPVFWATKNASNTCESSQKRRKPKTKKKKTSLCVFSDSSSSICLFYGPPAYFQYHTLQESMFCCPPYFWSHSFTGFFLMFHFYFFCI